MVPAGATLEDYWALSNRILELASDGYPRPQFLKDVLQLLLQFSGCDDVALAFRDGGRHFFCKIIQKPGDNFVIHENPLNKDAVDNASWSYSRDSNLEKLCLDIISKRFDPSLSWFTKNGSFWSGCIQDIPVPSLQSTDSDDGSGISIQDDFSSIAIVPIDVKQERIGLFELRSKTRDFFSKQQICSYEYMARTIGNAIARRRLQVALRERVKELTCLYGIAKLVQLPGISLDYILRETVKLLPPAWLYPDIASAQIVHDDQVYITPGFQKAVHSLKADIIVHKQKCGFIEIRYSAEKPALDDGPFLREERNLIDTIVQELSIIIEQSKAKEEKIKLQEQLRHADRLATIGQLVAGVTHELNEPLANILGFAQLAVKNPDIGKQTSQDLNKIISSALHAREVIKRLLTSARKTPLVKQVINLNGLIEDGLYFLRSRCNKSGIDLVCHLSKGLPNVHADRSQFLQVLTNLVVNAVQAMPHGGRIAIRTTAEDGFILLTVEDTGSGINQDVADQIFTPFFTTKKDGHGTGLGLSVVHGIVTSHGGEIKVESEVGVGTKFIIRLPINLPATNSESGGGQKK
jgi:signal transduction histidine kinase